MLTTVLFFTLVFPFILYVINFFINRWIWMKLVRKNPVNQGNPMGILFCFLSLFGTFTLIILYIMGNHDFNWFTPKELRKKK